MQRFDHHTIISLSAAGVVALLAFAFSAGQATAQTVPGTAEPGQIEKRFETAPTPKSVIEPVVPSVKGEAVPPEKAAEIKLTLTGIIIDGATVYKTLDFRPIYEKLLGQDITLLDVYNVANAITAKYRNDGYVLSRAIVPPQRIKSGVVTIKIIEGYINKVIIEGQRSDMRGLIDSHGEKITQSQPLRIADLERYLLLTNDIPGVTAKSVLRPSPDAPGASELVLMVTYKLLDTSFTVDNRGSRYAGPREATFKVAGNSLLALGERTEVTYITTRAESVGDRNELDYFNISHSNIISDEGTKLALAYTRTRSVAGYTLLSSDVRSRSKKANASVSHPFIRSRAENLSGRAGFTYKESSTDLLSDKLSEDRMSVVSIGATYDFVDRYKGITMVSSDISKGLKILNYTDKNSDDLSRAEGRADFLKVTADVSRLQNLYGSLNLLAAATGQYSAHDLLSGEEFGVGGSSFGRGYDASEITGDHGAAAKLELQYGGGFDLGFRADYQLYGFYDVGGVWHVKDASRDTLASTGGGARFNVTDWVSGYVEYAKPLTREIAAQSPDEPKEHRVFFSLTARY